jgi:hypothetical protein
MALASSGVMAVLPHDGLMVSAMDVESAKADKPRRLMDIDMSASFGFVSGCATAYLTNSISFSCQLLSK